MKHIFEKENILLNIFLKRKNIMKHLFEKGQFFVNVKQMNMDIKTRKKESTF